MARSSRRLAAAVLLTGVTALGASACSPIETMQPYSPSDGIRGELGEQIRVENLMILSPAEGADGTVLGAVTNTTTSPADVSFSVDGVSGALQVNVPAEGTVLLGPDHETLTLSSVPVPPGAVLDVQISTSAVGSVTLGVPVLDGTIPPYDEYVPSAPAE